MLLEMAFARKKVIEKVRQFQTQIDSHLILVLTAKDPQYKDHWKKEINTWLSDISRTKWGGNKLLSGDEYYNMLFKEHFESFDEFKEFVDVTYVYKSPLEIDTDIDLKLVYQDIEKILHDVSFDIANKKFPKIENYVA